MGGAFLRKQRFACTPKVSLAFSKAVGVGEAHGLVLDRKAFIYEKSFTTMEICGGEATPQRIAKRISHSWPWKL